MIQQQHSAQARRLARRALRHERAAEALGQAAIRFGESDEACAADLAIRACRLHRVQALEARAQAAALRHAGEADA